MTFEEYTRSRLVLLLRTATAICGNRHLGEEIVQDILIKLHAKWPQVSHVDNIDAYVRRMLANEYISWRRKWSRIVPTEFVPDRAVLDHSGRIADRDLLRREVDKLPRRQQVALALRYFDGLSDPDIAAAMGCTESSVRSFISRGLAGLRIELTVTATTPTTTPATPGSVR